MNDVRMCPECGELKTRVIDSGRKFDKLDRKRKCRQCGYTYYTVEILLDDYIEMNKPFYRSKKEEMKYRELEKLDDILKVHYEAKKI